MTTLTLSQYLVYLGVNKNMIYSQAQRDIQKGYLPATKQKIGKMSRLIIDIDDPKVQEYGKRLIKIDEARYPKTESTIRWRNGGTQSIIKNVIEPQRNIEERSLAFAIYE